MSEDYPCGFYKYDIIDETEKAVLAHVKSNTCPPVYKRVWLRKSQLKEFSDCGIKGYKIPSWLAEKKGLI